DVPNWDGTSETTLDNVIRGDTLDDGSRVSENRVYRLERGSFYIMASNPAIDYSFAMVAGDATDTGDGSERPPVIARGKYSSGDNVQNMFVFNGSGNNYYFENIAFTAVDLDGAYETQWTTGLIFNGNNIRAEFKGCVFNAWQAGAMHFTGKDHIVYLSDNVFRNGVATYMPFVGQQANFSDHAMDSLVMTNNTYFNNQAYWLYKGGQGLAEYVLFQHNTIYTSLINTLSNTSAVNTHINSNIFYSESSYGDTQLSRDAHWYTSFGENLATIYLTLVQGTLLPDAGLTEADRIVSITNNAYFTPQKIKDYHDAHSEISGAEFINAETQAMFDDNTAYPYLDFSDNVEKDPGFANAAVNTYVVDGLALQCEELFSSGGDVGWGGNSDRRNIDESSLSVGGDIMLFDWPLIEGNMEITESSLLTAGHDGLPVGNLNWNTSNRDAYLYPAGVGGFLGLSMFGGSLSNDDFDFTSKGYELSSYPNPATTTANISFKLPKKANVTISVYSIMGQKIQTITN
ncbi:MAG: T9SS type A sorting domain-containing protein, partial [Chlamydiia bacterium]|nr:T9SS type A sorting domain-containing protein [Chlamydiia bacterium]